MVNLIIVASIIIAVALIVIFAPRIKRWIRDRTLKGDGEPIPLFNCSIASKGNGSGGPDSGDLYDCVETKEEIDRDQN